MIKVNQISGMPQMKAAFDGWQTAINLVLVQQRVVDGFTKITEQEITFRGTVQPLDPEEIQLKPEGQRSWQWLQIHCVAGGQKLVTNDRIKYNDRSYKVMAVKDYSLNNFLEYHVVEDYEAAR